MYKNKEDQVKSDKIIFLSTDDKIIRSSNKFEHSERSENGQLNKYSKSMLIFQYLNYLLTLKLKFLKILWYNLVNKNKTMY